PSYGEGRYPEGRTEASGHTALGPGLRRGDGDVGALFTGSPSIAGTRASSANPFAAPPPLQARHTGEGRYPERAAPKHRGIPPLGPVEASACRQSCGLRMSTPSGGRFKDRETSWPWLGMSSVRTSP